MSGLEPLRGLLQVVEAFIEDKRRGVAAGTGASAAVAAAEGDLLGDLSSFLEGASLEELLSLRKRICLGGLRSIDDLLKGMNL